MTGVEIKGIAVTEPLGWNIRPAAARVWTEWVNHDRNARVWGAISAAARVDGASPSLRYAVLACAEALDATGAGLSMRRADATLEPVLATNSLAGELDELQFTLGQGPTCDAAAAGVPVLQSDVSGLDAGQRWPAFAPAATQRRVRGVFAFPIGVGAARLGVLSVYRRQAGSLRPEQIQEALVFADSMFVLALDHSHGISTDLTEVIDGAFNARRAEVHQAAGLIAAQQGIGVTDALARLRAYAYSTGRPLHDIAADVMAGRIRLESDRDEADPPQAETEQEDE